MLSFTLMSLVLVTGVICDDDKVPVPDLTVRIVQGNEAKEGQFPYQVFIRFYSVDKGYFFSFGGSIISKKYILTAGHCLTNEPIDDPSILLVKAGSIERGSGTEINITAVVRHPDFNSRRNNDVAILTTETDIEFTDNIKPIHLPDKGRAITGTITVSGWGLTQGDNTSSISLKLLFTDVPVVGNEKCIEAYGKSWVTDNMFCAGHYEEGGSDACTGDSGGPAAQDGLLVGIVGGGIGCGDPLKPGLYANLAWPSIRDFISKNTGM